MALVSRVGVCESVITYRCRPTVRDLSHRESHAPHAAGDAHAQHHQRLNSIAIGNASHCQWEHRCAQHNNNNNTTATLQVLEVLYTARERIDLAEAQLDEAQRRGALLSPLSHTLSLLLSRRGGMKRCSAADC